MHNECRSELEAELTLAYHHLGARAHGYYTLDGQLGGGQETATDPLAIHRAAALPAVVSQAIKERKARQRWWSGLGVGPRRTALPPPQKNG